MMKRPDWLPLKPLAAAIALAAPQLVFAQLEEIVVTAERRETTELTTAISVEVFTPEQLALDKLQTVDDLQNMTPNLSVNYQGFTIQSVNIRGVGNAVGNPNIQPGVAVMQDGMIMGETVVIQQAFLDIESIEVLRGPQGTFVGQASTGGAVRINSARPNFDGVSGYVEGRLGDYRDQRLAGAINLPLTEHIATRFAFSNESRDTFYDNNFVNTTGPQPYFKTGPHPGNTDNQNFRASILFEPNDHLSILGRAEFNQNRTDADAPYQPNPRLFVNPRDSSGFGHSRYADYSESALGASDDPYTISYDLRDSMMEAVSNRWSLDISYVFDSGIEFRSETGYQDNDLRTVEDQDSTRVNGSQWRIDVGPDNDYVNQNFLLISPEGNRVSWLVGLTSYYRFTPVQIANPNANCGYFAGSGATTPCPLVAQEYASQIVIVDGDTRQRHNAIYGQFLFDISDTLELEFGARYSKDNNENDLSVSVGILDGGPPFLRGVPCGSAAAEAVLASYTPGARDRYFCAPAVGPNAYSVFKDEEPTWKIGLNWSPGDEHFIYGFYSRGYKSGGVDSGLRFENETVDDYEFGYKGTLLDGRMQLQAGVFYMDYTAMQQQGFLVRDSNNAIPISDDNAIFNIGDSTIQGFEMELNGQFGGLGVNFGLGYTTSDLGNIRTYDERYFDPALEIGGGSWVPQCAAGETPVPDAFAVGTPSCFDYNSSPGAIDLSTADNLYSPELSWNFALDYAFDLSNGAVVRPRIAFSHADSSYATLFQQDDYYRTEDRDLVNFSVGYEREDWSATVYCTNCADETFIATVTGGDNSRIVYNAPRQFGLRFKKDF